MIAFMIVIDLRVCSVLVVVMPCRIQSQDTESGYQQCVDNILDMSDAVIVMVVLKRGLIVLKCSRICTVGEIFVLMIVNDMK